MAVADAANRAFIDAFIDKGAGATGLSEVHAAVDLLARVDLAGCREGDLDRLRGASQRLRGFAAAADARIARRTQELADDWLRGLHDGDGAGGAGGAGGQGDGGFGGADGASGGGGEGGAGDGSLGGGVGGSGFGGTKDRRSSEDTERDRLRGKAGAAMPSFESALERGEIDAAHVDAVAVALQRLDDEAVRNDFAAREAQLLGYAKVETPQRFRRRCADLARRLLHDHGQAEARKKKQAARIRQWWDHRADVGHLHLTLDAESWAKVDEALQAHLSTVMARDESQGRSFEELRVDAFVELVTASSAIDARVPEISVLIDWDTLRTGVFGEASLSESTSAVPLTPEAVRRMACDGRILPVVLGGDGVPLDVGRSRRLATPAQRRALAAMYRTCAHPDCSRPFSWCQIHHVDWWELDGLTDLGNMVPLCDRHHHQVHDGGWTLTIDSDRVLTWTNPAGTIWFTGDTADRPPAGWDEPPAATNGSGGLGGGTNSDDHTTDNTTDISTNISISGATIDATGFRRRRRSSNACRPGTTLFDHDTEPAGP